MVGSLLLVAIGAVLPFTARLGAAIAEGWLLRSRVRLAEASRLPNGTGAEGNEKENAAWVVCVRCAATWGKETNGDR